MNKIEELALKKRNETLEQQLMDTYELRANLPTIVRESTREGVLRVIEEADDLEEAREIAEGLTDD